MAKNRLGKGLGALIADTGDEVESNNRVIEIFIDRIESNPFQPRQEFEEKALLELSQSIKEQGIIQPITVRKIKPDSYQLVTGERRWRASKLAGLKKIAAIVRDYTDLQMMEIALIENLQREDLNPIEEAQAYQKMMEEFNMTQEDVAGKVGKSRSSVANVVRLLNLAPVVQVYVSRETISMGHARALLSLKDNEAQIRAAEYIIKHNLSVRETEQYINRIKTENVRKIKQSKPEQLQLDLKWVEAQQKLTAYLGTEVKIKSKNNKKVLTIECESYEDLEKIMALVKEG